MITIKRFMTTKYIYCCFFAQNTKKTGNLWMFTVQKPLKIESTLKSQYSLRTVAPATPLLNPALTGRGALWAGWGL